MVAAMGGCCQGCGYNKCYNALEMHHLDPSGKDFSFGKVIASPRAWPVIVKELKKCVLVCSNCHREIHAGVREVPQTRAVFNESYSEYRSKRRSRKLKPVRYGRHTPRPDMRKVTRPSREDLDRLVWEKSLLSLGRQLGVTDNAIRKWCKSYGIVLPPLGYHRRRDAGFSHEESLVSQKRVTKPKRLISREIAVQAYELVKAGMSYRKAAKTFGFKHWGMQQAFERYGLESIKRKMAVEAGNDPAISL